MGKTGPCCHCGVTSTPLWRNGPPDKPVLCNACGSRWRTKGSLMNYTPLHARENFDLEELKISRPKNIPLKDKQQLPHKKKQIPIALESEQELRYSDLNFRKVVERDVSNQSSSGSAISYSESCAHIGTTDASDFTGSAQSTVKDPLVLSKKKTFLTRPEPSPVEKLTKDLCSILHEQQAFNLTGSLEGDLIYESGTPIDSETGYGSVLIRPPLSKSIEEESEASSLPLDSKPHIMSEAYSASKYLPVRSASKETTCLPVLNASKETIAKNVGTFKIKKPTAREIAKRDKLAVGTLNMLLDRNSSVNSVDLNDLINFDVFLKCFTLGEQQQLMKYLPSLDTCKPPESLENMFKSTQFRETLSCVQQLLEEVFSYVFISGDIVEQCRSMQRNILHSLKVSEWAEPFARIKMIKEGDESVTMVQIVAPKSTSLRKPNNIRKQNPTEPRFITRSPKRACKFDAPRIAPSRCSSQLISSEAGSKLSDEIDDLVDNEGSYFGPRSLIASSPDRGGSMLSPSHFTVDNADNAALIDVPSNASLAEAVLLYNPQTNKTAQNDSPVVRGHVDRDESLLNFPSSSFTSKQAKYK